MADPADLGNLAAELFFSINMANRKKITLPAIGICLFCKNPLNDRLRFCDADCRDDFDHEQRLRLIGGHPSS